MTKRSCLLRALPFHSALACFLSVLIVAFISLTPALANEAKTNILFISNAHKDLPWEKEMETGLKTRFRAVAPNVQVFFEYLDLGRFSNSRRLDVFQTYLNLKYASKQVALILSEGPGAGTYLNARPDLLPASKRLYIQRSLALDSVRSIPIGLDLAGAISEMERLVAPKTVFVVGDAKSLGQKARVEAFQAALKGLTVGFQVEYLTDVPTNALLKKVSQLPAESAIFYLLTFSDEQGNPTSPYEVAVEISRTANAPVFSHWGTLMGSGVLGGYLLSGERVGQIAADAALATIQDKPLPEVGSQPFGVYYDWRQLERWGIDKDNLPDGAELLYYEPPLIEKYTWQVVGVTVGFMALSVLSFFLIIVNAQRRQAVASLEKERSLLTLRVDERTADLQESERKYRTMFEASRVGFALCKMDGQLVECNQAYLDLIGYTQTEAQNLTYWDLTPRSFEKQELQQLKSMEETGSYGPYEKLYIHKDGHEVPVLLNGTKLKGADGEDYIWSIVQDITERARLEKSKSEFVSTVSHELRTPLTSIRGALGLVMGGVVGELEGPSKELLTIANSNAEQLASLIDDILDFEKLQSETMEFHMERFDLSELVRKGIEINKSYAEQFDVQFKMGEVAPKLEVIGDKIRINQVLANLLSNAAKFSPTGEMVDVSVRQDGDWANVCVRDYGLGIAEVFQEHIFERFAQEDGSDVRTKGGTGLGLSICKTIMERHEGEISYETEIGKGTAFHFRLRLAEDEERAA